MHRKLAGLVAVLVAALTIFVPSASRAQLPEGAALTELAGCIAQRRDVVVIFLLDESGSLEETDPLAARVAAAKVALAGLTAIAEDASTPVMIDVLVAGFAVNFTAYTDWTALSGDSAVQLNTQLEGFAQRDDGLDTDYVIALEGARERIAARSAELTADGSDPPCKAVLWFTDGRFDIEDRRTSETKPYAPDIRLDEAGGGARAVDRGRSLLCDAGGIVDQLREAGVTMIAIALSPQLAPADIAFLGAVARGRDGDVVCGAAQRPTNGELFNAAAIDDLILLFDFVSGLLGGGTPEDGRGEVRPCARTSCEEGRRTFEIDASLRRFHVLAQTGGDGVSVELRAPGVDAPLVLAPSEGGNASIGGVPVRWSWVAPNAVTVDADYPADGDNWSGTWSITFVDTTGRNASAVARSQIFLYGDVVPVVSPEAAFRLGEPAELDVQLQRQDGTPIEDPDFIVGTSLAATVTDPVTGVVESLGALEATGTGFTVSYEVPDDTSATFVNLTLQLDVVTSSGVALAPVVRTAAVPVLPPPTFPVIEPRQLQFPSIVGDGDASAELRVTAAENAGGCLWFDHISTTSAPEDAGDVIVRPTPAAAARDDCIRLRPGEQRLITLELASEGAANGSVAGVVSVRLTSTESDRIVAADIPYGVELSRPIDETKRWLVFFGLLIPGVLLPLAFLYVANWFTARFEPTTILEVARVPVRVTGSRVERADGAEVLRAREFDRAPAYDGHERELSIERIALRARVARSPFSPPYGEATAEGAYVVGGGHHPGRRGGRVARTPLALPGSWLFVVPEASMRRDGEAVAGDVVAFVEAGRSADQAPELSRDVAVSLPGRVQTLREVIVPTEPVTAEPATTPEGEAMDVPPEPARGSGPQAEPESVHADEPPPW